MQPEPLECPLCGFQLQPWPGVDHVRCGGCGALVRLKELTNGWAIVSVSR
jgi:hypothetical protein